MTYDLEKVRSGRQPIWIVEIDLDECTNTFGSAPCTASGAAGTECFNARKHCQDAANYDGGGVNVHTYRFAEPSTALLVSVDAYPSLRSVELRPTRIAPGEGLGERGACTLTFQDHPHHDRGVDPYVSTRTYDPMQQGSFWSKLRTRNPYYVGRTMRVKSGYITDPLDLVNNFITRTYIIERITGPDAQGTVTITGKDTLKLADDNRAQAPIPNTGVLAADISAVATTLTLSPAGIGNIEYDASGTVIIGSETMTFTRAGDVLTVARGTDGTPNVTHDANDLVQQCWRKSSDRIDDTIYDLLVNYANVDPTLINTTEWAAEIDTWMFGSTLTTLIVEPTGVRTLVDEICNQYMIAVWFQDTENKIKLECYVPRIPPLYPDVSDANGLVEGSYTAKDVDARRLTEIHIYYDRRLPTEDLDETTNYRNIQKYIDLSAEAAEEFGDVRILTVFSRWFNAAGDVLRLGNRLLSRYRNTPRVFTFTLDNKDSGILTGDVLTLTAEQLQDRFGAPKPTNMQVLRTTEQRVGDRLVYECEEHQFSKRYATIGPNTLLDYTAESVANQERYMFISNNSGLMSNGDEGYSIL